VTLAIAFLALLDSYDRAAEKVRFPQDSSLREWSRKSEGHRKVIDMITDRKQWAKAFQTVDLKLGLAPADPDVRITIEDTDDKRPACSAGKDGRGFVRFNMRLLVPYQDKLDEIERDKAAGKKMRFIVPPMRLDAVIPHELAHVICGGFEESWMSEGIASYVGDDDVIFYMFNHRGSRVDTLDRVVPEDDAYARGMVFFLWLEKERGADGVRAFARRIVRDGILPSRAAADACGIPWEKVVLREKTWSDEYIAKYKNNP
jgi:hypothetical protein